MFQPASVVNAATAAFAMLYAVAPWPGAAAPRAALDGKTPFLSDVDRPVNVAIDTRGDHESSDEYGKIIPDDYLL